MYFRYQQAVKSNRQGYDAFTFFKKIKINFLFLIFLVVCVQSPLVGSGRNEIADNFILQIGRLHFDGEILKEFVDGYCSLRQNMRWFWRKICFVVIARPMFKKMINKIRAADF